MERANVVHKSTTHETDGLDKPKDVKSSTAELADARRWVRIRMRLGGEVDWLIRSRSRRKRAKEERRTQGLEVF